MKIYKPNTHFNENLKHEQFVSLYVINTMADQAGSLSMQGLRFPAPKTFDGKDEHWDLFQYRFRAYLCISDTRFKDLFKVAEASAEEIDPVLEPDQAMIALVI